MKPLERCDSGSLSATKARKGSILMFIEESKTHNKPAATHKTGECGIKNNVIDAKTAPIFQIVDSKYCLINIQ